MHFSSPFVCFPYPGLLSVFEMAELIFNQVFRDFGIAKDIVSDRGTQFTSYVWGGFMEKLVSLSQLA